MKRKKAIQKLVKLCAITANTIVNDNVRIVIGDEFAAVSPPRENREVVEGEYILYINIVNPQFKWAAIHKEVEMRLYQNVDYNYHPFTMAFFHEVGHLMTMHYFKDEALMYFMDPQNNKASGKQNAETYKTLPHELVADVWSLHQFLPFHEAQVAAFDTEVKRLLKSIY